MPSLLLVDDDVTFLRVLTRSMSKIGYSVWPAHTLEEARKAVAAVKPDFAVVDLHLDDENGLDVLDHLKLHSPRTVSVILSGYVDVASAVSAVKRGATDCLAKPVDADELDTCLKTARTRRQKVPDRVMNPSEAKVQHILAHWEKNDRNTTKTAETLGMHRRSLQRILLRAGMGRDGRPDVPSRWTKMRRLYAVWTRDISA
ncbi:MAG: response regulator [Pseudomonadota bacterium]